MKKLQEVEYSKIFSKATMDSLTGKSKESLKKMLGNKNLMQTMRNSTELLPKINAIELPYKEKLEKYAVGMCKRAYPIIGYNRIRIDAKIVGMGEINLDNDEPQEEGSEEPNTPEYTLAKRRIINGITQGSSVRGSFGFLLYREYLDKIDPTLVDKYKEILNLSFGIYDNEEAIALLLLLLSQGQKIEGGSSDMEYDEENDQFVIKARGLCLPILIHEIIKGLYEIVGTEGFGADKEKNQQIIGKIDRLDNEPRDLQYGKFVYDALNKLYIESESDDDRIREILFSEIYRMEDEQFVAFIERAINDSLTSRDRQWIKNTILDIKQDLKNDDIDEL